ncbi:MAG: hypothetical protein D6725_02735 [Planctomycetota bacterium]|nr:MAG: hypothetical protein D6725_02735 [Planctomycetota bacterium]
MYLISYPKVVFMYPTFLASLICGIYMTVAGNADRPDTEVVALVFLGIFALNMLVFSFDFPRTTSLTLLFFVAAVVMGALLLIRSNPNILPAIAGLIAALKPWANNQFYFVISAIFAVIFVAVFINVRFDYWEVRPNELLHHHGILSNLERMSAPNLRIDKEINDVFEYLLLGSGRLILHPANERRAIVLENVPMITRKEAELTRLLSALQVRVREDEPDADTV